MERATDTLRLGSGHQRRSNTSKWRSDNRLERERCPSCIRRCVFLGLPNFVVVVGACSLISCMMTSNRMAFPQGQSFGSGVAVAIPRTDSLKSIAVVAYGRDHEAEVDVREVGFY